MRHLCREGVTAGRHRIRRLMRLMGMEAVYRRPRTSVASPEHRIFPYLLRDLVISRADHVWCADITYVPVTQGFFYLVAVMDWATRHVLSWRLSNTMDASFCVGALGDALVLATPGDPEHRPGLPVHQRGLRRPGAGGGRPVLDGRPGPVPRQHLHRTAVAVAEVRGRVPLRASRRSGGRTDHRLVDRLLQRGAPALVAGRADTGRGLSRKHGGVVRTIRRGATHGEQPAQRRLRAWRDCRAPVPSVFPSEASPDGKTEVIFKPGSEESVRTGWLGTLAVPGRTCSPRAQARSPRAFETIGIHLNIALGLSNEVGPP